MNLYVYVCTCIFSCGTILIISSIICGRENPYRKFRIIYRYYESLVYVYIYIYVN